MKNNTLYFLVTNDLITDQRMQRITGALVERGRKVVLVGRILKEDQTRKVTVDGVHWVRFKLFFNKGKFFYFEHNLRLFFYLIFKRSKSVCAIDFDTLPAIFLLGLFTKFPFAFDAHEYYTEVPELQNRNFEQNLWNKIASWTIPKADLCYTVNVSISDIYSKLYNKDFHVIRNVPFRNDVGSKKMEGPKIILYQGALNVGRGIEESILMMEYFPNYQLWIVGEGDIETDLKELAEESKWSDRIFFLGRKDPLELKQITANAWVGLNILQGSSLNYYFSLANKFFDYVQAGIPGVSMKYPEYIMLNEEYEVANLIDQCTVKELAEALKALEDSEYYNVLKSNTKKAAQIWNWEVEKVKLLEIYEKF